MNDLEITVEITDEAIEADVELTDEEINVTAELDTNVTVLPLPDLAYGGSSFVA